MCPPVRRADTQVGPYTPRLCGAISQSGFTQTPEESNFHMQCCADWYMNYFMVNDMQVAIEAKSSSKVSADHLRVRRALMQDHPRVTQRIIVCLEPKSRRTEDGILVLAVSVFCQRLRAGELF